MHPFAMLLPVVALAGVPHSPAAPADSVLGPLREQARALAPLVHTNLSHRFLKATAALPPPPSRMIYRDTLRDAYFSAEEAASLPDSSRTRLAPVSLDGRYYYQTRYGSILTYVRAIELLATSGITKLEGKRVLDFGYGRIGHLRVLASLGAAAVGVDVDPELRPLYSYPGDQGPVPGFDGRPGSVTLVNGWFPGDSRTRAAVGGDYDVVISKNTLKGGHEPSQRARQKRVIDLGVTDSLFVGAMFACMKPGGVFLMYTISSPMGNGGCPFPDAMLRAVGFDVVAYDKDDTPGARSLMRVLHGGEDGRPSKDDDDSRAMFTLLRKPSGGR